MTKREKELLAALKPLALYGHWLNSNPMLRFIHDDVRIGDLPMAPTVGDAKRAAEFFPDCTGKPLLKELKAMCLTGGRLCKH